MRNFKKMTALCMAAALGMAVPSTAFAEITETNGYEKWPVHGTYEAGSTASTLYSVEIYWQELDFTYTAAGEGTWDPATHQFDGQGEDPGWSSTTNAIVVVNHSNKALNANLTFEAVSTYDGKITGSFRSSNSATDTLTSLSLADAAEGESLGDPTKAPSASCVLTLSGNPGSFTGREGIGLVTVAIADAQ